MRHARTQKLQLSGPTVHSLYCGLVKPVFHLANLFARTDKKVGMAPSCLRRIFSPVNFNQSHHQILIVFTSCRAKKVAKWKVGFKRVRAKFSKNCAFCDTSIIFTVRFHFGIRTNIRYGTISEMDVVDQKFRISYVMRNISLLNFTIYSIYEL